MYQKEKRLNNETSERFNQLRVMEDEVKQQKSRYMKLTMERDDAVSKFEESARASGALLKQINELEQANESVRRELAEAKEVCFLLNLIF